MTRSPSWVMFVNCPTLCPLQLLLLVALQIDTRACTCCTGAMNEILDLQRDLHATDFVHCEENTFGARTLLFYLSEIVLPPYRVFVTHGFAGFTGVSILFLAF